MEPLGLRYVRKKGYSKAYSGYGVLFWVPYKKDYSILGCIPGSSDYIRETTILPSSRIPQSASVGKMAAPHTWAKLYKLEQIR